MQPKPYPLSPAWWADLFSGEPESKLSPEWLEADLLAERILLAAEDPQGFSLATMPALLKAIANSPHTQAEMRERYAAFVAPEEPRDA